MILLLRQRKIPLMLKFFADTILYISILPPFTVFISLNCIVPTITQPSRSHPMITQSQNNIFKPKQFYTSQMASSMHKHSPHPLPFACEPSTIKEALMDP